MTSGSKHWVHEYTYRGIGAASFVHRHRLARTISMMDSLEKPLEGTLADFGCSNGYILSILRARLFEKNRWRLFGFDRSRRLLALAEARNLPNTEFHSFDLNVGSDRWCDRFDIVTCFETLEHTGNYRNAVLNLYRACRPGGKITISIPNERAFPGITKYLARPLVRKKPYGDFVAGRRKLHYLWHLLQNRYVDVFREPPSDWWGHHLGFDSRRFAEFVHETLLLTGKCRLVTAQASAGMFNHFYLLEKRG